MVRQALSKSKRFNEIFHIMLEHRLPGLLKDIAATAHGEERATPPTEPQVSSNGKGPGSVPARVREMMEDLGPTFIKIGQLLGTRPDLIPKEFIEEFKKMYDQTPPTPFPDVRILVEDELGKPLKGVFKSFEEKPIASASIGQVHRAVLHSGETVAVKVQHPGIEERMKTDFELLKGIVQFTERVFSATQVWQPVKHLEEVRHMLNKELDFTSELKIMTLVEKNFRDFPEVKIPHAYPQFCTRRVIVMEFVPGTKFHNRQVLKLTADDDRELARIITHAMAKQIFVDRLFHADPSPGNLLLMGPRQLCFLDFGAFGQITKNRAKHIFEFIMALSAGNIDDTARVIVEMCEVTKEYDPKRFLFDLERVMEYYENTHATPADPVLLDKIIALANTHGMLLPADFMLITRALYQFDGMCKELDPDYELVQVLMPFIQQQLRERFLSPQATKEQVAVAVQDLAKFLVRMPTHLEQILIKLEKGQLAGKMEVQGLEEYKRHSAALVFFGAFSVLLAFSVLATALAYAFGGAGAFRMSVFASVVVLLVWLVVMVVTRQNLERRR